MPKPTKKDEIFGQQFVSRGGAAIQLTMQGTEVIVAGQVGSAELKSVIQSLGEVKR